MNNTSKDFLFLFLFVCFCSSLTAQDLKKGNSLNYKHSIGVSLGFYNQLTYKFLVVDDVSVDFGIGKLLFQLEETYGTFAIKQHYRTKQENTYRYFGAGFVYRQNDWTRIIGLQFPLGVEIINPPTRVIFFTELSPIILYARNDPIALSSFETILLDFKVALSLGLRYIFVR